jgi:ABC-2 type transport system ATP-binding protein
VINHGRIVALDTPELLGGRQSQEATVKWTEDGAARAVKTSQPSQLITQRIATYGGEVPELEVTRPTLEETYLRLIGEEK